jgi:hypothetical protein
MVKTTAAALPLLVAGAAISATNAFVTPMTAMPAVTHRASTVMRADGPSSSNPFKSGAVSLFKLFTANPANRNSGSSGNGGMQGGNNGGDNGKINFSACSRIQRRALVSGATAAS